MRVNIYKDRIKNAAHLPALPNVGSLMAQLSPSYWALHSIGREAAKSRPLYSITDDQKHAAHSFLQVTHAALCSNITTCSPYISLSLVVRAWFHCLSLSGAPCSS